MDRSFRRRVEQLVLDRLCAGQEPEALLAELKTRMGDAEADALLSRAEARLARRRQPRPPLATRILMAVVYVWTGVLAFQNLSVLLTVLGLSPDYGLAGPLLATLVLLPLLNIGLLCAGVLAFRFRRSAITAILYAGAILFVFPLGLFVGDRPDPAFAGAAILVSVSALLSYATVALLGIAYWQSRRATPAIPAEAFD